MEETQGIQNGLQELEGVDSILCELDSEHLLPSGYPFARCVDAVRQKIDESEMTADFVIVTRGSDINRNGHKVQIVAEDGGKGLILDNFEKNPVVFFDHGFGFPIPIARSSMPKLSRTKATATAHFSQVLPEAGVFFGLIAEGILNTASISFLPLKARRFAPKQEALQEDEYTFRPGMSWDFISNDLLEWSVVGVPADPGAVRKHLERGNVHGERITQAIRPALEKMAGPKKVQSGPGTEELKRRRLEAVTQAVQSAFAPIGKTAETINTRADRLATEIRKSLGRVI